ncbi:hypothetical protein [Anatilimnocola floriformis]|uniref:hypothetical protein n=1 Tax=Anatilimnocola floriformis TaxID=2948575 RepID=UPI0020C36261|nr:hypothetical protein [Anatilimnocola floriformis]
MKVKVQFKRLAKGKKKLETVQETKPVVRVPRIAKLMALSIHFDQLIRDGKVQDQAQIAELGHVCRPRLTQIMNLLALAPNIQEQILTEPGAITERQLRPIAAMPCWKEQCRLWSLLNST